MLELPRKKYMRPDEVATYLSVSRSVVYLWCDHGRLQAINDTGGTLRVLTESVKEFEKRGMLKKQK